MSAGCTAEHARWLEAALTDGVESLPETPRRELQSCAACAAGLAEMGAIQARLQRTAEDRERILAEAERSTGDEDERIVREIHARRLARPGTALRRAPRLEWALAAVVLAAAALVLGVNFLGRGGDGPAGGGREVVLGSGGLSLVEPTAAAGLSDIVEWRDGAQEHRRYRVQISGLVDGRLVELRSEAPVDGMRLELERSEVSTWPEILFVSVQALSMDAQPIEGAEVSLEVRRADS